MSFIEDVLGLWQKKVVYSMLEFKVSHGWLVVYSSPPSSPHKFLSSC